MMVTTALISSSSLGLSAVAWAPSPDGKWSSGSASLRKVAKAFLVAAEASRSCSRTSSVMWAEGSLAETQARGRQCRRSSGAPLARAERTCRHTALASARDPPNCSQALGRVTVEPGPAGLLVPLPPIQACSGPGVGGKPCIPHAAVALGLSDLIHQMGKHS